MRATTQPQIREHKTVSISAPANFHPESLALWRKEVMEGYQGESTIIEETRYSGAALATLFALLYPMSPEIVLKATSGEYILLSRNFETPRFQNLSLDETFLTEIAKLRDTRNAIWTIANPTSEIKINLEKYTPLDLPQVTAQLTQLAKELNTAYRIVLSGDTSFLALCGAILLSWPLCHKLVYQNKDGSLIPLK